MISNKTKTIIFLGSTLLLIFGFKANAGTGPVIMASWQAKNYIPTWFTGKILPVLNTGIEVKAEFIDNGKIINLMDPNCEPPKDQNDTKPHPCRVRWYLNSDLVLNEENGYGIKSLFFENKDVYKGNDIQVTVTVPFYKNGSITKTVFIPVMSPEGVIDVPNFNRTVDKGENLITAWPLFFNSIDNLSFKWTMDNQDIGQNSPVLKLTVDPKTVSGTEISMRVQIQNLKDRMQFSESSARLKVK